MSDTDDNREGSRRPRALKAGKLVMSDWTMIDCTIRDINESGARLEFGGMTQLPKEFRLLIVSSNEMFSAELAWQRGLSAGMIRFTGPSQIAPAGRF